MKREPPTDNSPTAMTLVQKAREIKYRLSGASPIVLLWLDEIAAALEKKQPRKNQPVRAEWRER